MDEYGIFNDEGLVADGFISVEAAEAFMDPEEYEDCHVGKICHDHPDQEAEYCEECNSDEET